MQSAGSALDTANVRSRQTNKKPSPTTSLADTGPVVKDVSGHFGQQHGRGHGPGRQLGHVEQFEAEVSQWGYQPAAVGKGQAAA
jgi:hypothetical protein